MRKSGIARGRPRPRPANRRGPRIAALAGGACLAAALTVFIPAPRQTRRGIEALVAATSLDAQMKTFSLWDDFESGRRGRRP